MKKYLSSVVWLLLFCVSGYFAYKAFGGVMAQYADKQTVIDGIIFMFVCGFSLAAMIYNFMFRNTSNSLNMYKIELEKKNIGKEESSSKIKVLESKIEVLEKALDDALKK